MCSGICLLCWGGQLLERPSLRSIFLPQEASEGKTFAAVRLSGSAEAVAKARELLQTLVGNSELRGAGGRGAPGAAPRWELAEHIPRPELAHRYHLWNPCPGPREVVDMDSSGARVPTGIHIHRFLRQGSKGGGDGEISTSDASRQAGAALRGWATISWQSRGGATQRS